MADYDILINAHMQGFVQRDITNLSSSLKNLITTIDRVNDQTKNYARSQKALNSALGYGADGQRVYAKTMLDASKNAAVLSSHLKMTRRQVNDLNSAFGKDMIGAGFRKAIGRATEFDTKLLQARKNLSNIQKASRAIRFTSAIRDAQSLSKNLLNVGKNLQYVGRNLTIGLTLPLIQFFRLGLDSFKRLETEVVRFNKIVGQSTLDLYNQQEAVLFKLVEIERAGFDEKVLEKRFDRMGTAAEALERDLDNVSYKFGVARDLVQGIAADFATIGLTDTQVIGDLVELTAAIEKVGDVDITTSREFIQALFLGAVNTQNFNRAMGSGLSTIEQYRLAVDQVRGTLALFNTIENNTVVTMQKLSKAIPEMIAVTNLYGLTTSEAAAAFAPMIAAGFEVGASGNSIKVSLQRLVAPAKQNREILDELAGSIGGFNFEVGVGIESVAELARSFIALENAKGAQGALELYARLFGVRQGSRMLTAFVELSRFQEDLANSASEAYGIANTIVDNVNKAVIESGLEDELRKALGGGLFTAGDIAELGQIARVAGDEYAKGFDSGGSALYEAITKGQAEANQELKSTLEGGGDVLDQISSQAGKIILAQARGIGEASSELNEELERALQTPAVKLARAKETFKGISRELIPPLVDALNSLMPTIKRIANFISEMSNGTKSFIAGSFLMAMALGPLISVFSNLTQVMGLLAGTMFKTIGAISRFSLLGRGGFSLAADTLAGVKNLDKFGSKLSRISEDTYFFKGTKKQFQRRLNRASRSGGGDDAADLRRLFRLNQMFAKAAAKTAAAQQTQASSTVQLTQAQQRKILAVRGLASATRQLAAAEQILAGAVANVHGPLAAQATAMAAKKKATTQAFVDRLAAFAATEAILASNAAGMTAAAAAIEAQALAMAHLAASIKGLSIKKIDALTKLAAAGGVIPVGPSTPVRSAPTSGATGARAPPATVGPKPTPKPIPRPVVKPSVPPATGYLGTALASMQGSATQAAAQAASSATQAAAPVAAKAATTASTSAATQALKDSINSAIGGRKKLVTGPTTKAYQKAMAGASMGLAGATAVPKPAVSRIPAAGYGPAFGKALASMQAPAPVVPKVAAPKVTGKAAKVAAKAGQDLNKVIQSQILQAFAKAGRAPAPEVLYALRRMDFEKMGFKKMTARSVTSLINDIKQGALQSLNRGMAGFQTMANTRASGALSRGVGNFLQDYSTFDSNNGQYGKKAKTKLLPSRFETPPDMFRSIQRANSQAIALNKALTPAVKASTAYSSGMKILESATVDAHRNLQASSRAALKARVKHDSANAQLEKVRRNIVSQRGFSSKVNTLMAKQFNIRVQDVTAQNKLLSFSEQELRQQVKQKLLTQQELKDQLKFREVRQQAVAMELANDVKYQAAQKAATEAEAELAAATKAQARRQKTLFGLQGLTTDFTRAVGPQTPRSLRGYSPAVNSLKDVMRVAAMPTDAFPMRGRNFASPESIVQRFNSRAAGQISQGVADITRRAEKAVAGMSGVTKSDKLRMVARAVERYREALNNNLLNITKQAIAQAKTQGLTGMRAAAFIKQRINDSLPAAQLAARGSVPLIRGGAVGPTGAGATLSGLGLKAAELQQAIVDNLERQIAAAQAAANSGDTAAQRQVANLKGRLAVLNRELTQPQIDYINKAIAASGGDRAKLAEALRELIAGDKTLKNKVSANYSTFAKRLAAGTLEADVVAIKVMQAVEAALREIEKTGASVEDLGQTLVAGMNPVQAAIDEVQAETVQAAAVATNAIDDINPDHLAVYFNALSDSVGVATATVGAQAAAASAVAVDAVTDVGGEVEQLALNLTAGAETICAGLGGATKSVVEAVPVTIKSVQEVQDDLDALAVAVGLLGEGVGVAVDEAKAEAAGATAVAVKAIDDIDPFDIANSFAVMSQVVDASVGEFTYDVAKVSGRIKFAIDQSRDEFKKIGTTAAVFIPPLKLAGATAVKAIAKGGGAAVALLNVIATQFGKIGKAGFIAGIGTKLKAGKDKVVAGAAALGAGVRGVGNWFSNFGRESASLLSQMAPRLTGAVKKAGGGVGRLAGRAVGAMKIPKVSAGRLAQAIDLKGIWSGEVLVTEWAKIGKELKVITNTLLPPGFRAKIKAAASYLAGQIKVFAGHVIKKIVSVAVNIKDFFVSLTARLAVAAKNIAAAVMSGLVKVKAFGLRAAAQVRAVVAAGVDKLKVFASFLADQIRKVLKAAGDGIKAAAAFLVRAANTIKGYAVKGLQSLKAGAVAVANTVRGYYTTVVGAVKSIPGMFKNAVASVKTAAQSGLNAIKSGFGAVRKSISGYNRAVGKAVVLDAPVVVQEATAAVVAASKPVIAQVKAGATLTAGAVKVFGAATVRAVSEPSMAIADAQIAIGATKTSRKIEAVVGRAMAAIRAVTSKASAAIKAAQVKIVTSIKTAATAFVSFIKNAGIKTVAFIKDTGAKIAASISAGIEATYKFIGATAIKIVGGVRIAGRQAAAAIFYAGARVDQFFFNLFTALWELEARIRERLAPIKAMAQRAYNAVKVAGYRIGQLMTDPASMFLLLSLYADKARTMILKSGRLLKAKVTSFGRAVYSLIENPGSIMFALSVFFDKHTVGLRKAFAAAKAKVAGAMSRIRLAQVAVINNIISVGNSIEAFVAETVRKVRILQVAIVNGVLSAANAVEAFAISVKTSFINMAKAIKQGALRVAQFLKDAPAMIRAAAKSAAAYVKSTAKAAVAYITSSAKAAAAYVKTAAIQAAKSIKAQAVQIAGFIKAKAAAIKAFAVSTLSAIRGYTVSVLNFLKTVGKVMLQKGKAAAVAAKNIAIKGWNVGKTIGVAGLTIGKSALKIGLSFAKLSAAAGVAVGKIAFQTGKAIAVIGSALVTAKSTARVAQMQAAAQKAGTTLGRGQIFRTAFSESIAGTKAMVTQGWGGVFTAQKGLLNTARTLGKTILTTLGNSVKLLGSLIKAPVQIAAGVIQMLQKNMGGLFEIGKAIGNVFKSIVKLATDLVKGLMTAASQLAKTVVSTVVTIGKSMFGVLKKVTKLVTAGLIFGPAIAGLVAVVIAIKRLTTAFKATGDAEERAVSLKERFSAAVAKLKAALTALFTPFAKGIASLFGLSSGADDAGGAFSNLSALVLVGIEKISGAIERLTQSEGFKKFVDKAVSAMRQLINIVSDIFKGIGALISGESEKSSEAFGRAMDRIKLYMMSVTQILAPIWKGLLAFMLTKLKEFIPKAVSMFSKILEFVSQTFGPTLVKYFAIAILKITDILFSLPTYIPDIVFAMLEAWAKFQLWSVKMTGKLVTKILFTLVNLIPGFGKILGEMIVLLARFLEAAAEKVGGWVKWLDPTYYASKGFEYSTGIDIGDGLANGIARGVSAGAGLVGDALDSLLEYDWNNNAFTEFTGGLEDDLNKFMDIGFDDASDALTQVFDSDTVEGWKDSMSQSIEDALSGSKGNVVDQINEWLFGEGGDMDNVTGGLSGFLANLDIPEYEGSGLQEKIDQFLDGAIEFSNEKFDEFIASIAEKKEEARAEFERKYGVSFDALPFKVESDTVRDIRELSEDIGYAYAQAIDAGGESLTENAENAANSVKDALLDGAQKFIDAVVDILGNAISKLKSDLTEQLQNQKDAYLSVFDEQIAAIDALEKAEQDLFKEQERIEQDRQRMRDRALQQENYRRNRALAIYEGRVDDARMMDLEQRKTDADNAAEDKKISRDRVREEQQRQRDIVRAILERQKEDAAKTFDEIISNFEKFVEEIGKHGTYNQEELEAQFQAIVGEAQLASEDMLSAFEDYYTAIPDLINQYTDPTVGFFETPLNELVQSAKDIFGLESGANDPNTILGATAAMLSGINNQFTDPEGYLQGLSGEVTAVGTAIGAAFDAIVTDEIEPVIQEMNDAIEAFDPDGIMEDALVEANLIIQREYAKMLGSTNSIVDDIADGMDELTKNIITSMAKIEAATSGAAGGINTIGTSLTDVTSGGDWLSEALEDALFAKVDRGGYGRAFGGSADNMNRAVAAMKENILNITGTLNKSDTLAEKQEKINNEIARLPQGAMKAQLQAYFDKLFRQGFFGTGGQFVGAKGGIVPYGKGGVASYGVGGFAVPGFGSTAVPAILHGGEYVLNKAAVDRIGLTSKILESLNKQRLNMGGGISTLPYLPDTRDIKFGIPRPDYGKGAGIVNSYNTNNTTNIYVDNFIGEDEWFRKMLKDYNINHKRTDDRRYGITDPIYTTYKGASF